MINSIPANKYCRKIFDGTHDTPKPSTSGMPLVTSKNILGGKLSLKDAYNISEKDYISIQKRSAVSQWDVLFSMIGSVGEVYLEKNKDIPYAIKNVGVFSCGDEYRAKWLYYYLQSPASKKFINNYLAGAVQKFLGLGVLRDYPVFPFDETKTYAIDILDSIDSKIELNNKINAELESLAKTLYDYWFVQFDFPDKDGKPYKTSGGKMVWNGELKKDIPDGWNVDTLSGLILKTKSGDWGSANKSGDSNLEVLCIRGTDIEHINGHEDAKIPVRFIKYQDEDSLLRDNDLVIEISGGSPVQSTGRITLITNETLERFNKPLNSSNFCRGIVLKNPKLGYIFLYTWQKLYENGVFFNQEGKTSGIRNLLFDSFADSYRVAIPSDPLIEKVYSVFDTLNRKKQGLLKEIGTLIELRDWLLPMLMNGQVSLQPSIYF